MKHGVDCTKITHVITNHTPDGSTGGYLHFPFDDVPYDVDGVLYCGRCHVALDREDTATERLNKSLENWGTALIETGKAKNASCVPEGEKVPMGEPEKPPHPEHQDILLRLQNCRIKGPGSNLISDASFEIEYLRTSRDAFQRMLEDAIDDLKFLTSWIIDEHLLRTPDGEPCDCLACKKAISCQTAYDMKEATK